MLSAVAGGGGPSEAKWFTNGREISHRKGLGCCTCLCLAPGRCDCEDLGSGSTCRGMAFDCKGVPFNDKGTLGVVTVGVATVGVDVFFLLWAHSSASQRQPEPSEKKSRSSCNQGWRSPQRRSGAVSDAICMPLNS